MNIKLLGIDIAKNVFQLHGVDGRGAVLLRKRLRRNQLKEYIANLSKCTIVMEACGSSNYWGREFIKLGHEVKLISAQHVKAYVKSKK